MDDKYLWIGGGVILVVLLLMSGGMGGGGTTISTIGGLSESDRLQSEQASEQNKLAGFGILSDIWARLKIQESAQEHERFLANVNAETTRYLAEIQEGYANAALVADQKSRESQQRADRSASNSDRYWDIGSRVLEVGIDYVKGALGIGNSPLQSGGYYLPAGSYVSPNDPPGTIRRRY